MAVSGLTGHFQSQIDFVIADEHRNRDASQGRFDPGNLNPELFIGKPGHPSRSEVPNTAGRI